MKVMQIFSLLLPAFFLIKICFTFYFSTILIHLERVPFLNVIRISGKIMLASVTF